MVRLGEEGNDCHTRVTTDNGDLLAFRLGALDLGDKTGSTDDIEGGNTEQLLGVVDAMGLEDFRDDGDG